VLVRAVSAASSLGSQLPSIQQLNQGSLGASSGSVNADDVATGLSQGLDALGKAGVDASSVPPQLLYVGIGVVGAPLVSCLLDEDTVALTRWLNTRDACELLKFGGRISEAVQRPRVNVAKASAYQEPPNGHL
jgi:hypothetical protein